MISARILIGLLLIVTSIILGFALTFRNAQELHKHEREQIEQLRQLRAQSLRRHETRDAWLLLTICKNQNTVQRRLHLRLTDCSALILKPLR